MTLLKTLSVRVATLLGGLALAACACAQYPVQAIKVFVPIPPGGAPDVVARLVSQRLSEALGQPVVVENRAGSNGVLATEATAKATPDGYTLMLGPEGMLVINPHLYSRMSLNPMKELVPVASVFRSNFVMTINASLPARTFQEFIELARKARPPTTDGRKSTSYKVSERLHRELKIAAARDRREMSALLEDALRAYLRTRRARAAK